MLLRGSQLLHTWRHPRGLCHLAPPAPSGRAEARSPHLEHQRDDLRDFAGNVVVAGQLERAGVICGPGQKGDHARTTSAKQLALAFYASQALLISNRC
jgi:hypothetical protein